jgi:beta-lactamase regulating signal transducer with metallopeptidase domain
MMNWLYYLLEANLYLAVFYGFYRLCLHQETFYTLNRFFLILSAFISFLLPLLKVSSVYSLFSRPESARMVVNAVELEKGAAVWLNPPTVISAVYLIVAAVFLLRIFISLAAIFKIYFKARRKKIDNVVYVELDNQQSAFSFFNILFINPNVTEKKTVLKHEMIHISQNHSADILFFELLQIISWFSPVVYMIKQDIKLIHEYIADELTTASELQKHDYALFLIENSFGVVPAKLSNQIFNQSLIKRRIKMLNKEKSGRLAKYRLLLLAPITLGLIAASTMAFSKDYAVLDLLPQKSLQQDTGKLRNHKLENVQIIGKTVNPKVKVKRLPPPPPVQPAGKAAKSSPPAPQIEVVRFPPPRVTKKRLPPPPPAEPAGKAAKTSVAEPEIEVVRFPPPIIKKKRTPPPPPVEPAQKTGTDEKLQSVIIHGNPTPVQTAPATLKQISIKLKEPELAAVKQKTAGGEPIVLTNVNIIKANP